MKLKTFFPLALLIAFPCFADFEQDMHSYGMSYQAASRLKTACCDRAATFIPDTTATYDLGSSSYKWRKLYCSSDATVGGTLDVTGATTLSSTAAITGVVTASAGVKYAAAVFETVAAAGTGQGDGPLTAGKFFHLITAANETKAVTLPACASGNVGEAHFLMNAVNNKFLIICPATGGAINGGSANACVNNGATGSGGKTSVCVCQAANTWYCG